MLICVNFLKIIFSYRVCNQIHLYLTLTGAFLSVIATVFKMVWFIPLYSNDSS